jgi:ribosomal protein L37AE/L43A
MGYAKIACCDRCAKKRYVERINAKWLCLDCQDIVTEQTVAATKAPGAIESESA